MELEMEFLEGRIKEMVDELKTYCDTVTIIVSCYDKKSDTTYNYYDGSGNVYARELLAQIYVDASKQVRYMSQYEDGVNDGTTEHD